MDLAMVVLIFLCVISLRVVEHMVGDADFTGEIAAERGSRAQGMAELAVVNKRIRAIRTEMEVREVNARDIGAPEVRISTAPDAVLDQIMESIRECLDPSNPRYPCHTN